MIFNSLLLDYGVILGLIGAVVIYQVSFKKDKKVVKAEKSIRLIESEINEILLKAEDSTTKTEFELNYFSEELLKKLIKLDDVDLVKFKPNDKQKLKQLRKDVIKKVQVVLKELDAKKKNLQQ